MIDMQIVAIHGPAIKTSTKLQLKGSEHHTTCTGHQEQERKHTRIRVSQTGSMLMTASDGNRAGKWICG
jgi:hypothetical protein